jgi:hypothetical protein
MMEEIPSLRLLGHTSKETALFMVTPAHCSACYSLYAGFLICLFFYPENGDGVFPETSDDFQWTTRRFFFKKIELFITTAVRTANTTYPYRVHKKLFG